MRRYRVIGNISDEYIRVLERNLTLEELDGAVAECKKSESKEYTNIRGQYSDGWIDIYGKDIDVTSMGENDCE